MVMAYDIDLIIFDCDGTLVDSEYLNCLSFAQVLNSIGLEEYDSDKVLHLFKGRKFKNVMEQLAVIHDRDFPDDLNKKYIDQVALNRQSYLKPVKGANQVISQLAHSHRICVGSNGEYQNIVSSLSQTGLKEYFPDHMIFNAAMVKRPKPDPDLFLHAAEILDTKPERTLVIEDTSTGVNAAVAAGMHVIGYTGTAEALEQRVDELTTSGAKTLVHDFRDILRFISGSLQETGNQAAC